MSQAEATKRWKAKNPDKVRQYAQVTYQRRKEKTTHDKLTYFVKCQDYVKIGSTKNLTRRLTELQTGCPYPLELLGTCSLEEKVIHTKFESLHHQGEWFILSAKLQAFIQEVIE